MNSLYMRGFALSFLFVPINSSILSQFSGRNLGQVAGLLNLFRQIGGSIGIAMVATILNIKSHQNYADLSQKVTAFSPAAQNFYMGTSQGLTTKMSGELGFSTPQAGALKILYYKVQNQVFMMSFLQLVWIMMAILLISIIPLWRLNLKRGPIKPIDAH